MTHTIFIVNDDAIQLKLVQQHVREKTGCRCITASSGRDAIEYFLLRTKPRPDLMIVNLGMTSVSGVDVIRAVRRSDPLIPIIALANGADSRDTMEAIRLGADDILHKPVNMDVLKLACRNLIQRKVLSDEVQRLQRYEDGCVNFSDMAGQSERTLKMLAAAKGASDSTMPLTLEGEAGVGKEMLARAIHGNSARSGKPFVTINCKIWSEAIQGQRVDRSVIKDVLLTKLVSANGGTVLIKEPDCLTLDEQVFLMDTIKEKSHGANYSQGADENLNIRYMIATQRPLAKLLGEGSISEQLYARFTSLLIRVPALRERKQDVMPLVEHFLERYASLASSAVSDVDADSVHLLLHYHWPENISQLAQVMQHVVIDCKTRSISAAHLMPHLTGYQGEIPESGNRDKSAASAIYQEGQMAMLKCDGNIRPIDELEAELIQYAIKHYKGKMTEVARRLGIGRSTLYRKIQDYDLKQAV